MHNPGIIVARASGGTYDPSCLRLEDAPFPVVEPGQVVVENILISLDPTHLNWVKLDPALQFLPISLGDPMIGQNIAKVVRSKHPGFEPGDVVLGPTSWRKYTAADPALLRQVLPEGRIALEHQMSLLSHIGQAATAGMLGVGQATAGDAVLVSAAAGATGAVAAQIAKGLGCYTVGIAGGPEKCRYLVDDLGLHAAVDYHSENLSEAISRLFPAGIDLYFDNVGGRTLDAVLQNMAQHCRIAVCGAISQYNSGSDDALRGITSLPMLVFRQARMEGFLAGQFPERADEFEAVLLRLYEEGNLRIRSHVLAGIEAIPNGLQLLLDGKNMGKLMVRV